MEKDNLTNFDWDANNDELEELCHRVVTEDLSVVRVRMAESVFEKAQIRLKQTLTDKVSSFGKKITFLEVQEYSEIRNIYFFVGGTLGLFIGASFLSLVEVIFWIVKLVCRPILYQSKEK